MGVSLSGFVGLQVTNITFSNENLGTFLQMKGMNKNSPDFPYSTIDQFMIIYADDLIIFSDKELENAEKIHMLIVEFVLFCSVRMGLKFARNKTVIMSNEFKFLGHTFKNSANSIPESKKNNFKKMRAPRSRAETISRLASISYFENTLPQLRKVADILRAVMPWVAGGDVLS